MNWTVLCATAGTAATVLFVVGTLPMLIKAARSKDLHSYSGANLVIANCGNLLQAVYVISLPVGPIWGLHLFNTIASLLMLTWWHGHRRRTLRTPTIDEENAPRTVPGQTRADASVSNSSPAEAPSARAAD